MFAINVDAASRTPTQLVHERPAPQAIEFDHVALCGRNLNFSVAPGEVLELAGGSSIVRTLVLAHAAGLLTHCGAGSCRIVGVDMRSLERRQRSLFCDARIGRLLCSDRLDPGSEIRSVVAAPLLRLGLDREAAITRACTELDILGVGGLAMRNSDDLSADEQQLVLCARASAARPQLLVLERPEARLPDASVAAMSRMIGMLTATFKTGVLLCSNNLRFIRLADRSLDLEDCEGLAG